MIRKPIPSIRPGQWHRRLAMGVLGALWPTLPLAHAQATPDSERAIVVGSKPFGESYLLAEMFAQLLESRGVAVERRPGLGATEVAFAALRLDVVDVYPEYTGTGLVAILHDTLERAAARDPRAVFAHVARRFMQEHGVRWLPPLGFENTYAIAVRRETASRYGLRTLTDLARVSRQLRAGFTADFIGRRDGLAGLRVTYGMTFRDTRPLSPALKYQALASSAVDVIDGYSTDGLLLRYDLVTLQDDQRFFPPYEAAALLSPRVSRGRSDVIATLSLLSGRIDEARMRALNRRVEVDREDIASVARSTLAEVLGTDSIDVAQSPRTSDQPGIVTFAWARRGVILAQAQRHLVLVLVALVAAILVAVPLGLALDGAERVAEGTIKTIGVLQTIPSIALLAFMIPILGVGIVPALVALWLYGLYPIIRGTYTGIRHADRDAVETAEALGATPRQRLIWVRLPLAMPVIMAGVRTSAVITIGAATLAAFIGAGGLGEPIVEGLALADTRLILSGALPAALLALAVDGVLAIAERRLRPPHLRSTLG